MSVAAARARIRPSLGNAVRARRSLASPSSSGAGPFASTSFAARRAATTSPASRSFHAPFIAEVPDLGLLCPPFAMARLYTGEWDPASTVYTPRMPITRRALLAAAAAAPLVARTALGFGDSSRFIPAVARHGGRWDARVSGLRRLAWDLERRTSVEVIPDARPFALDDPKIFEYPFLYLGGEGDLPPLSADEVEGLRRFLTFGGFVLADANDGSEGAGFDRAFRREMARVLPQAPLSPVPFEHVLFKTFFLLDSAPGRLLNKPQLEACSLGKRAAVVYSQNDLAGAWNRDQGGGYEFDVTPGGEPQRELAFRVGINICMYALCLDYKDDAVHLPLIMQKRR